MTLKPNNNYQNKIILLIGTILLLGLVYRLFHGVFFKGIMSYGDGPYFFVGSNHSYLYTRSNYNFGVSQIGIMFSTLTYSISILLGNIFGDLIASNLAYFGSLLLPLLIIYFLWIKKNNYLLGLLLCVFFLFTNFVFEQIIVWPLSYFLNIIPIILISYNFYAKSNDRQTISSYIVVLSMGIVAHPFILLISTFYYIFNEFYLVKKINFLQLIIKLTIIVLLHLYRIFPFVYNTLIQNSSSFYAGAKEGVFSGYSLYINVLSLFMYKNYPGNRSLIIHGLPIKLFYLITTIGIIIWSLFKKRNLYLIFIYLFFFNLALGPQSPLTGYIWNYLFTNYSVFGFFRSYSRWYIVCIFVVMVMISNILTYKNSFNKKWIKLFIGLIILLTLGLNYDIHKHGNYNGFIETMRVPSEYEKINSGSKSSYIISFPVMQYEAYNWSINENYLQKPNNVYFLPFFSGTPVIVNGSAYSLELKSDLFQGVFDYRNTPRKEDLDSLFLISPIKKVLIHKDLHNIINNSTGLEFTKLYFDYFKNNKDWYLYENNKYFSLYERKQNVSFFFKNKLLFFKQINPTKYSLNLTIPANSTGENLNFLQSYHNGWKLYPGQQIQTGDCTSTVYYSGGQQALEDDSLTTSGSAYTGAVISGGVMSYIVQRYETLRSIVTRYGYDYDQIRILNPYVSMTPKAGALLALKLPKSATTPTRSRDDYGDARVVTTTGSRRDDIAQLSSGQVLSGDKKSELMSRGPTTECVREGYTFVQGEELSYLWRQPLWDDTHEMVYDYANGWKIDLSVITPTEGKIETYMDQGLREGWITPNPDGSYNVSLTLYFRPQSWFYLGLIISGTTLFGLIGWLLWDWRRRKYPPHLQS